MWGRLELPVQVLRQILPLLDEAVPLGQFQYQPSPLTPFALTCTSRAGMEDHGDPWRKLI